MPKPRASHQNPRAFPQATCADSGPVPSFLGRAAHIPTAPGSAQTSLLDLSPCETASTAAGASASAGLSPGLTRFFDTLGIADDIVWRPAFDGEQPPF